MRSSSGAEVMSLGYARSSFERLLPYALLSKMRTPPAGTTIISRQPMRPA
ncbi:MAG TPA: hypothetical protein VGW12_20940 [Pyrinomonadaceae bacterium]|nr:hypothetical protein [Pyrinomonadaceae bacterium]